MYVVFFGKEYLMKSSVLVALLRCVCILLYPGNVSMHARKLPGMVVFLTTT
jgi:hypothetical protein